MKQNLTVALALACIALVVSLVVIKRGDKAQHQSDADAIAGYSNQLFSVETQIDICKGTITMLSNRLDEARSESMSLSNQLTEAKSSVALGSEQITALNQKIATLKSDNQTLAGRVMELTNQIAGLTKQIVLAQASLDQANKDYALLENRLRRDVAERVVVERKFNNLSALTAQMEYLKWNPDREISAESIYAGLDMEVKSNRVHVISPD